MQNNYYKTIDELSIFLWVKIHETNDVYNLLIDKNEECSKKQLHIIWNDLQNQYLKHFGLDEATKKIIEKERNLILLYEDAYVNENRDQFTFIEIEELEILALRNKLSTHKIDFYLSKSKLESILKFPIDMKNTSVKEYYSYFKMLSDGNQ